ncbi:MAG: LysM peptidoglycan-binding domain-containing protein [Acidimicrobiales bacterium]
MAAVQRIDESWIRESDNTPYLRVVTSTPTPLRTGPSLAQRRARRARMVARRRRTVVALALIAGLAILAIPGHAFGGITGSGLPTDLANSADLASGMQYVVQPGDTLNSIARMVNPLDPSEARQGLVHELGSSVVVAGEHVLIP